MSHPQAPDKPRIPNPYLVGTSPPPVPAAPPAEPAPVPTAPEPKRQPGKKAGKK